jgi:hypothetical protein
MADFEKLLSDLPEDPIEASAILFARIEQGFKSQGSLAALTEACGVLAAFYESVGFKQPRPLEGNNPRRDDSIDDIVQKARGQWRLQFEAYRVDIMQKQEHGTKKKVHGVIQGRLQDSIGYAVLTAEEKEACHGHLKAIREIIEKSELDDRKKNNLFEHIATLSREIDKNGTRTDRFFAFVSDVGFLVNDLATKAEPLVKEIRDILRIISKARARKEGNQLPPGEEMLRLLLPASSKGAS